MKILSIVLVLACIALAASLFLTKRSDTAQHESDSGSIADLSNQLVSAQAQIVSRDGAILVLSNSLSESQSASTAFSNNLIEAQSTVALGLDQITNLTRQITGVESEKQTLDRHAMDLTNQIAALTLQTNSLSQQVAQTQTNLNQSSQDYVLLENRFRIDVGERVVSDLFAS